jgi:hypothetical protein
MWLKKWRTVVKVGYKCDNTIRTPYTHIKACRRPILVDTDTMEIGRLGRPKPVETSSVPESVRLGGVAVATVSAEQALALRAVNPDQTGSFVTHQVLGRNLGAAVAARGHVLSYVTVTHKTSGREAPSDGRSHPVRF